MSAVPSTLATGMRMVEGRLAEMGRDLESGFAELSCRGLAGLGPGGLEDTAFRGRFRLVDVCKAEVRRPGDRHRAMLVLAQEGQDQAVGYQAVGAGTGRTLPGCCCIRARSRSIWG